jgi:GNAT superfamily N-acetyltransferase
VPPDNEFSRVRGAVSRHGWGGVAALAAAELRKRAYLSEHHVWYELDLTAERPHPSLEAGLTLRQGDEAEVGRLGEVEIGEAIAWERLRAGNDWWVVLDQGELLFNCWIFRGQTPVLAAPGGQLGLPPGCVCLEDSATAEAARGRGIAPAAWALIADQVLADGDTRMITKVAVENTPSRRAVNKAGFEEVAVMHFVRRGPSRRTSVEVLDSPRGEFFYRSLA